ncbi:E3 ubiquitin/ISG15 ligase TRIM25-like [Mustelus asterias]
MAALSCFKKGLAVCPICLELLSDPVTTNCGHNFCAKCLEEAWDEAERQSQEIACPQCREPFTHTPELKKNTLLISLIGQLSQEPEAFSGEDGDDDVPCDWCLETVFKAEKTCLTCMASYCPLHLRPHIQNAAYQGHETTSPIRYLQEKKCGEHRKIQDMFCTGHSIFMCAVCKFTHPHCKTASLEEKCKEKQIDLQKLLGEISKEIKVAEEKLDYLAKEHHSIKEKTYEVKILIKERLDEIKKLLQTKEDSMRKLLDEQYAEIGMNIETASKQLLEHIEELNRAKSQIESLAKEKDQWRFIKATVPKTLSRPPLPEEAVKKYNRRLEDSSQPAVKLISSLKPILDTLWQEILKYGEFCGPTFDPKTAHRRVILWEGNRKISYSAAEQTYAYNPERFRNNYQVLCSQKFSQGCHYWDIDTMHSSGWAIGVAYGSINGGVNLRTSEKAWCVEWDSSNLSAWHNNQEYKLKWERPQTIRVCLNFNSSSVSFYSVSNSVTLLHEYHVAFQEPVHPACGLTAAELNNTLVIKL